MLQTESSQHGFHFLPALSQQISNYVLGYVPFSASSFTLPTADEWDYLPTNSSTKDLPALALVFPSGVVEWVQNPN
jgi:hypothetical protein